MQNRTKYKGIVPQQQVSSARDDSLIKTKISVDRTQNFAMRSNFNAPSLHCSVFPLHFRPFLSTVSFLFPPL